MEKIFGQAKVTFQINISKSNQ